jgi:hypothetical protein
MRKFLTAMLGGAAALTVAGAAGAAGPDSHIMKVGLPDGSIATIEYQGDVAPKVSVAPAQRLVPIALFDSFEAAPFIELDRMAAEMDRQAEMLMRAADGLQPLPGRDDGKHALAAFKMPAGATRYSFTSTATPDGTCGRANEMKWTRSDAQPEVKSRSWGKCGAGRPDPLHSGSTGSTDRPGLSDTV